MRLLSQPAIAALFAAAIVGAFFLPVIVVPMLAAITPLSAFEEIGFDGLSDIGLAGQLFFASFPLAALVLLAALLRACPAALALIAGAVPIGVTIWAALNINDELAQLGLPVRANDFTDFLGAGAWLYIGAATGLVLLALFDRGRG